MFNTVATIACTVGVAGVHVSRPTPDATPIWTHHDTAILFTFVKEGSVTLEAETEGKTNHALVAGDAYVIPPFLKTRLTDPSSDCEIIETTLPATFHTTVHD